VQWRSEEVRTYRNNSIAYADPTHRVDLLAGYVLKRTEATYRFTVNAKNLSRSRGQPVGFKPGSNDGYYFKSDPELIFSLEVQF
jgi:hypothetical protein